MKLYRVHYVRDLSGGYNYQNWQHLVSMVAANNPIDAEQLVVQKMSHSKDLTVYEIGEADMSWYPELFNSQATSRAYFLTGWSVAKEVSEKGKQLGTPAEIPPKPKRILDLQQ